MKTEEIGRYVALAQGKSDAYASIVLILNGVLKVPSNRTERMQRSLLDLQLKNAIKLRDIQSPTSKEWHRLEGICQVFADMLNAWTIESDAWLDKSEVVELRLGESR